MQPFVGVAGELYSTVPGSGTFTLHADLGLDIFADIRPCFAQLGLACIITGKFSRPVVYYDDLDAFYPAGLEAPSGTPTAASGGAGNITGSVAYYYTFVHEAGGLKRAESNPSPLSNTLDVTDNDVDLSGIDGTAPDSRVNKVYIYSARNDNIPRKCGSVNIGTTTFTDNMTDEALAQQEPLPVKTDSDGVTIVDIDARGVPPYTEICFAFHNRVLFGRDPEHMDYIWFSYLNEAEGVNQSVVDASLQPLGSLRTTSHEAVRGFTVTPAGDECMVFHEGGCDGLQGFGPTTFALRRMSQLFTTIAHHTIAIVGDGIPVWAAEDGVCAYDGAFRNLMENALTDYFRDQYRSNTTDYQNAVAAYDRHEKVYKLLIPHSGGPSIFYIAHCRTMLQSPGSDPFWTFDREAREVTAIGNLSRSATQRRKEMHHVASDGYVRRQNIDDDADDDGDTYLKHFEVWTKAFMPRGTQGGDDGHGVTVTDITMFVKTESVAVSVTGHGGDDEAWRSTGQWSWTIPASAATIQGTAASPKTAHHTTSPEAKGLSGKTVLFKYSADSPLGVEVRGQEFNVRSGSNMRP